MSCKEIIYKGMIKCEDADFFGPNAIELSEVMIDNSMSSVGSQCFLNKFLKDHFPSCRIINKKSYPESSLSVFRHFCICVVQVFSSWCGVTQEAFGKLTSCVGNGTL